MPRSSFSTSFNQLPLRKKIRRSIVITVLVVLSLAALAFTIYEFVHYTGDLERTITGDAQKLAMGSAKAAREADAVLAQELLDVLAYTPEIESATIYLNDGRILAHYTDFDAQAPSLPVDLAEAELRISGDEVAYYQPLLDDGQRVGLLRVQGTQMGFLPHLFSYMGILFIVLLVGCIMAWLLADALQRRITAPVEKLLKVVRRVTRNEDFSLRSPVDDQYEMGELSQAFNAMLDKTEAALRRSQEAEAEVAELNARLEERVAQRTRELEEANRELESFSYSVSHDLRAPLRHIQGYAEMLERSAADKLEERPQRYLRTINEAAGEMGELIDDLLAFSRMGRQDMTEEALDLNALVEQVRANLTAQEEERDLEWQIDTLPEVKGDVAMIRLVLHNLMGNAVKYTRKREKAVIRIESEIQAEEGHTVISIQDNGAGFDMQYANKLFGVFQRLHRQEDFEGTGIGLATVRRILSRHGAKVWAEAVQDEGATFSFTLSLANQEIEEPELHDRNEKSVAG